MTVRLVPVGEGELEELVALPARLHGGDPGYVPPFRAATLRDARGETAIWRYARRQLFLARLGDEVVGRIGAIVNPRVRTADGGILGQVGYFDSIDDVAVAGALFDAAFAWLRAEGIRQVVGPMNGGAHRIHRLQTSGFEKSPFFLEPRNPAYYPRLFAAHGFRPIATWSTYEGPMSDLLRVRDFFDAPRQPPPGYRTETLDPADPGTFFARIGRIVDEVFARRTAFGTPDPEELIEAWLPIVQLASPWDTGIHARGDEDVGLWIAYPDWAPHVRAIEGDERRYGEWREPPEVERTVYYLIGFRRTVPTADRMALFARELTLQPAHGRGALVALVNDEVATGAIIKGLLTGAGDPRSGRTYALYGRALD